MWSDLCFTSSVETVVLQTHVSDYDSITTDIWLLRNNPYTYCTTTNTYLPQTPIYMRVHKPIWRFDDNNGAFASYFYLFSYYFELSVKLIYFLGFHLFLEIIHVNPLETVFLMTNCMQWLVNDPYSTASYEKTFHQVCYPSWKG